jgi:NTE family protein
MIRTFRARSSGSTMINFGIKLSFIGGSQMESGENKKIGLALGGGSVLGAAHVGVLKALEEFDINISFVAGTSIGAFIGALIAFGKDSEYIEEIVKNLNWLDISSVSLSQYGLLSNKKLGNVINECIGKTDIISAEIPLAIVATDISSGQKVVLKDEDVASAVMASTCIPGIFVPVEINDKLLVDGGIVENVPVSVIKDMGADLIIGVDLKSKLRLSRPRNIIEVLLRSFDFTLQAATRLQIEKADILIAPDLSNFNTFNVKQVPDLIEKGYDETIKILKELR